MGPLTKKKGGQEFQRGPSSPRWGRKGQRGQIITKEDQIVNGFQRKDNVFGAWRWGTGFQTVRAGRRA